MRTIVIVFLYSMSCTCGDDSTILDSEYPWLRLPRTPTLPMPCVEQYAEINGVTIWYTTYGPNDGVPVLFLHGGFANSNYWGFQVKELKSIYRCILMDSRGHGRSTTSSADITYDRMTTDVVALLDYLAIPKVNLVGWSDGAIIGLNIAMKYPDRLSSLFVFGANYIYTGVKDVSTSRVFMAYLERTRAEYETMNPINDYPSLYNNLTTMWSNSPNLSQENFMMIDSKLPVWIVDGDHEEAFHREQPDTMASWIPQAGELILPRTSHFAFIQNPAFFTASVARFLTEANCFTCDYTISNRSSVDTVFYAPFYIIILISLPFNIFY